MIERSSSMHRRSLCPGSAAAEAGLPDRSSVDSTRGDRIHDMMRSNDFSTASPEEMDTVASLVRMSAAVEGEIIGSAARTKIVKEQEFFIQRGGTPVIVGHPDRILVWEQDGEQRALILDFKTGYLEVDSAEENLQLLCYAVALWQSTGIAHIFAKIIQPFSKGHNVVEYNQPALIEGGMFLYNLLDSCNEQAASRVPSEPACRYCKAVGTARCRETAQLVDQVHEVHIQHLSPERIAQRLEAFAIAEKIIEKERAEYKAMLSENADAIPGYYLKPGNTICKIHDAQKTFEIVEPIFKAFVTADTVAEEEEKVMAMFQACVTVNKGKLETAIGEATGLKGKALDDRIKQLLEPVIVKTTNAPSLEKMPKAMLKEKGLV